MHTLPIRGQGGQIRWGYRLAAALGPWELVQDRGTPEWPQPLRRILRAEVRDVQALALQQSGLRLVVPRPRGALTWPVLQLELDADGQHLTALLGEFQREA